MSVRDASMAALIRTYYPSECEHIKALYEDCRRDVAAYDKAYATYAEFLRGSYDTYASGYDVALKMLRSAVGKHQDSAAMLTNIVRFLIQDVVADRKLDPTISYNIKLVGDLICQKPSECSPDACTSQLPDTPPASPE